VEKRTPIKKAPSRGLAQRDSFFQGKKEELSEKKMAKRTVDAENAL